MPPVIPARILSLVLPVLLPVRLWNARSGPVRYQGKYPENYPRAACTRSASVIDLIMDIFRADADGDPYLYLECPVGFGGQAAVFQDIAQPPGIAEAQVDSFPIPELESQTHIKPGIKPFQLITDVVFIDQHGF